MNHLSLFSGAAGGDLAFQHLLKGFRCVGYVEIEKYCQAVLAQRIKDGYLDPAPIFGDIKRFISEGYGKHIYILKQEIRAFRKKEDYNREEKQKIVLKSLILLTYLKKVREKIKRIAGDIYHEPLMLVLVNTVNLAEARKEKPDLIVLDIVMPQMDGLEVLKVAKGDSELKDIPVVLLTNLGQRENIEEGLKLGADDYIIKAHFTPDEVVGKVKKVLRKKA